MSFRLIRMFQRDEFFIRKVLNIAEENDHVISTKSFVFRTVVDMRCGYDRTLTQRIGKSLNDFFYEQYLIEQLLFQLFALRNHR